jgi:hypothetical protein
MRFIIEKYYSAVVKNVNCIIEHHTRGSQSNEVVFFLLLVTICQTRIN